MASQTIPDFAYRPEQYAVHNARPEPIEFMWGGIRFTLPPCDVVGPRPSTFDDGSPVPGSLLIVDAYTLDRDGMPLTSGPHNWKAKEAIRAILGVVDGSVMATSKLSHNGVSYLPVGCTREQFAKIKEGGEARYRESLVEWATDTVQGYEEARSKAKQAGVNTMPPGADFYKAQAVLEAHHKRMSGIYEVGQVTEAVEDDDLAFMVYAKAKALQLAGSIGDEENVDKAKLVEKLLQDPKVSREIRRKYSLRKRGYMDPEQEPGAEQPPEEQAGP